jgi:hypothetical protein
MPFPTSLFGAHVGGRSGILRSFTNVFFPQSQAEINDVRIAIVVDQDVAGLYISMNQPLLVSVMQRLSHGRHQFRRLLTRKPGLLELRRQIGTLDIFRDDEEGKFRRPPHVVNRDDVRMFETGYNASFGQIKLGVFGTDNPISVGHLDGHGAAELVIMRQINQPESTFAEQLDDPVASDRFWQFRRRSVSGRGLIDLKFYGRCPWIAFSHKSMLCFSESRTGGLPRSASILAVADRTSTVFGVRVVAGFFEAAP